MEEKEENFGMVIFACLLIAGAIFLFKSLSAKRPMAVEMMAPARPTAREQEVINKLPPKLQEEARRRIREGLPLGDLEIIAAELSTPDPIGEWMQSLPRFPDHK